MTGARVLLLIFVVCGALGGALGVQLVVSTTAAAWMMPSSDAILGYVVGVVAAGAVASVIGTLTDD